MLAIMNEVTQLTMQVGASQRISKGIRVINKYIAILHTARKQLYHFVLCFSNIL